MQKLNIDDSDIRDFIMRLSSEAWTKAQKKAMQAGAQVMYNAARQNMQVKLKAANHRGGYRKDANSALRIYYSDTLLDAIMKSVFTGRNNQSYFKVRVGSNGKKTSKTYLAPILHQGAKEEGKIDRRTRKGLLRGRIKPTRFFSEIISPNQSAAYAAMENTLIEELNKLI